MAPPRLVFLPGDGIGPEIGAAARTVLAELGDFEIEELLVGGASIDEHGTARPARTQAVGQPRETLSQRGVRIAPGIARHAPGRFALRSRRGGPPERHDGGDHAAGASHEPLCGMHWLADAPSTENTGSFEQV